MAQLGLKDLHIAILTNDVKEELTYEAPLPVVDVISANINPTINTAEIYADDRLAELLPIIGKIEVEMETAPCWIDNYCCDGRNAFACDEIYG